MVFTARVICREWFAYNAHKRIFQQVGMTWHLHACTCFTQSPIRMTLNVPFFECVTVLPTSLFRCFTCNLRAMKSMQGWDQHMHNAFIMSSQARAPRRAVRKFCCLLVMLPFRIIFGLVVDLTLAWRVQLPWSTCGRQVILVTTKYAFLCEFKRCFLDFVVTHFLFLCPCQ